MTDREKLVIAIKQAKEQSKEYGLDRILVDFQAADMILGLLKEQEDEKKRIMKVIWDTLHEGLSIDTVADQDWVYERIRHRIEDT